MSLTEGIKKEIVNVNGSLMNSLLLPRLPKLPREFD